VLYVPALGMETVISFPRTIGMPIVPCPMAAEPACSAVSDDPMNEFAYAEIEADEGDHDSKDFRYILADHRAKIIVKSCEEEID